MRMSAILLYLAAALYAGLATHFWRTRWRGAALAQPMTGLSQKERAILLLTLILHGITLSREIFAAGAMHFGFSEALSLMLWLAIALYWVESFYARMEGLQMLGFPLAAVCVVLPALIPSQHVLVNADSLAYRGHLSPFLAGLPPLLTMEKLLFRLIHIAFLLLTLTLLSGILFSETLFGKALSFDHKTVFAFISWLIFAALLLGRHLRGWRGRHALRWTLAGFIALLLAYVGSRFVLEVILGRAA